MIPKHEIARSKLALEIVEHVAAHVAQHDGIYVDEVAKEVACLIPDTRAEVQADIDGFPPSKRVPLLDGSQEQNVAHEAETLIHFFSNTAHLAIC